MKNKTIKLFFIFFLLSTFTACLPTDKVSAPKSGALPNATPPISAPSDEPSLINSKEGPILAPVPAALRTQQPEPEIISYTGTSN